MCRDVTCAERRTAGGMRRKREPPPDPEVEKTERPPYFPSRVCPTGYGCPARLGRAAANFRKIEMVDDVNLRDFGGALIVADDDEQDSGVEPNAADGIGQRIDHPFDLERIRISTKQIVIQQLVTRIRRDEIDLAPDFQRLRGIWKHDRKSRLIEFLLLRIPLPVFVGSHKYDNWAVVDGLQRMSTIYDYVNDSYSLVNMEYLDKLNGMKHKDLPRALQRRIGETQIVVNVIEPGTPGDVMFNIFRRINTGSMKLNGQEIRHALNPSPVREFLRNLADTSEFRAATDDSISKPRMADRDCVLRFLAFHMIPIHIIVIHYGWPVPV